MADERRLDTLQEEIKLMKGELKQSLASVRDYLLNMELPSSEISNILSALGDEGEKVTMKGSLETPKDQKPLQEPMDALTETEESLDDENAPDEGDDLLDLEEAPEKEDEEEAPPEDSMISDDDQSSGENNPQASDNTDNAIAPDDEMPSQDEDSYMPEDTAEDDTGEEEPEEELPIEPEMSEEEERPMQEEHPMQYESTSDDANMSVPKVNMLANLINWVAKANREIGREQLPTFLEVYGISGHLSPELKEVIIRLSEITEADTEGSTSTEIWSQSMLLLHGILTGGDAPLHPVIPAWNTDEKDLLEEEIIEVDKQKEKQPVKLKLVLPDEDGEDREFCINLTPEADGSNGK